MALASDYESALLVYSGEIASAINIALVEEGWEKGGVSL